MYIFLINLSTFKLFGYGSLRRVQYATRAHGQHYQLNLIRKKSWQKSFFLYFSALSTPAPPAPVTQPSSPTGIALIKSVLASNWPWQFSSTVPHREFSRRESILDSDHHATRAKVRFPHNEILLHVFYYDELWEFYRNVMVI